MSQRKSNKDLVREVFKDTPIHTLLSKQQIIDKLQMNGMEYGSILPSDYCYNRTNKNLDVDSSLRAFKLFMFVSRGFYEYVGENYPYTGPVIHKPRTEAAERIVGHYKNGVLFPAVTLCESNCDNITSIQYSVVRLRCAFYLSPARSMVAEDTALFVAENKLPNKDYSYNKKTFQIEEEARQYFQSIQNECNIVDFPTNHFLKICWVELREETLTKDGKILDTQIIDDLYPSYDSQSEKGSP